MFKLPVLASIWQASYFVLSHLYFSIPFSSFHPYHNQGSGLIWKNAAPPRRSMIAALCHDDVIKWKHFPRYWPFVRGIHRSPVNFPHKGQWRGALMFSLMCARINSWVNNREAGDLRHYRRHYDVIVMLMDFPSTPTVSDILDSLVLLCCTTYVLYFVNYVIL